MPDRLLKERSGSPPFVEPYLRALGRMQDEHVRGRDDLIAQAIELLGAARPESGRRAIKSFSYGPTGLLGAHTHYFDGFALLLSLPLGTAVVAEAREGGDSEILFAGSNKAWQLPATDADRSLADADLPSWVRVVAAVFRTFAPDVPSFRVAVSSTIFASCLDAYMGALGAAAAQAAEALSSSKLDEEERIRALREVIEEQIGMPFGLPYVIGALHGDPGRYLLIDATTLEHLPVEAPSSGEIGWGLVHAAAHISNSASFYVERKEWIEEALLHLRQKAFPQLRSFRELEHRDLQRALGALPGRFKPYVRHLVTENRRVQKLVTALRKQDWQFVGALLVMSHASTKADWKSSSTQADVIIDAVEAMSLEGMYGGCMSSRGGCAVVCGQPYVVPQFFERLSDRYEEEFGYRPTTMLL